jgi:hypothetical protein
MARVTSVWMWPGLGTAGRGDAARLEAQLRQLRVVIAFLSKSSPEEPPCKVVALSSMVSFSCAFLLCRTSGSWVMAFFLAGHNWFPVLLCRLP